MTDKLEAWNSLLNQRIESENDIEWEYLSDKIDDILSSMSSIERDIADAISSADDIGLMQDYSWVNYG